MNGAERLSGIGRLPCTNVWGAGFLLFWGMILSSPSTASTGVAPGFLGAPETVRETTAARRLGAPEGLSAMARAGFNLLQWDRTRGRILGYRIYRSLTPGGPYSLLSDAVCAPDCVFVDRQVANGTWYYYVVRAYDDSGNEGKSSREASAQADTAPPGARITSIRDGQHFTGRGPDELGGTVVDAVSGVVAVRVGIMRGDTKQWWNGKSWEASDRPLYINASMRGVGFTRKWVFNTEKVAWVKAMAYTVHVMVRDSAGYEVSPANTVMIFVDTPAELTASVAAAPASVTEGQPVNVSVLIANTGGSEALNVRPDLPVVSGDARFVPVTAPAVGAVPSLAPGEFATFSWSFSSTAAGNAMFRAGCAGENALTGVPARAVPGESNKIIVRRAAALEVAIAASPSNVREGTSFTVRMQVRNVGQSAARVTSVALEAANPELVRELEGPRPVPPFTLAGGKSRELVWTASARAAGVLAFTGAASGHDAVSGIAADSTPHTSAPVGVAAAPRSLQLAASKGSGVVGSEVEVTAVVQDESGTPVPGTTVAFSVLAGRGTLVAPAVVSDEFGNATTVLRLADEAGIATVESRVAALLASISVEAVLPGGAEQVLSRNFFDPSRGETADVRVYQPSIGRVRVRVFSLGGDLVTTIAETDAPAGWATFTWNGKDSSGGEVANGVYFFSVQAGGNMMSRRIIVLRR